MTVQEIKKLSIVIMWTGRYTRHLRFHVYKQSYE